MSRSGISLFVLVLVLPASLRAQFYGPPQGKKTINVSAREKIRVPADKATIKIGYENVSDTKNGAFEENKQTANKIIQALLDAKVQKDAIESASLNLEEQEGDQRTSGQLKKPKYSARQDRLVNVSAGDAQKVVDIAVAAGANRVTEVTWSVADPQALRARAYTAALRRARETAEQTATQIGLKLGEILNVDSSEELLFVPAPGLVMPSDIEEVTRVQASLKLYPGMVEEEGRATVTFEIESEPQSH